MPIPSRAIARVLAFILFLSANGCSYSIDIVAVAISGKLSFTTRDDGFDCVENVYVTAEDGAYPVPEPGDDIALMKNGAAYWWTDNPVTGCFAKLPIVYGQRFGPARPAVSAKRLRTDVIYEVTTQGGGAYGGGRFRIRQDGRIENLPYPQSETGQGS